MNLTILHLSDIHIRSLSDSILNKSSLIASSCFNFARDSDICIIVITGDIAFSGENLQYIEAKKFLEAIKKSIQNEGCPLVDIITVPGNHDCLLMPTDRARAIIIEKVISDHEEATNEQVIELCTKPQEAYFDFQNTITDAEPIIKHKLWNEYEFTINNKTIRVSAINAAWMSRIPEQPGQLVFPIDLFTKNLEETANIRFALLHHPLNWYCQNSYHPLRQALRSNVNIILSGHEHRPSSGTITDTNEGSSLYFEAAALQSDETNIKPSFSVFFISDDSNSIDEHRCVIEPNNEIETSVYNYILFDQTNKTNGKSGLTKEFQELLSDPGGNFTHPEKDTINLDDIFIYPDVKVMNTVTSDENTITSIEKVLFKGNLSQRILLLGEDKTGKTTVLLRAFNHYHREGLLPLFIKAHELSSSSEKDIIKFIERQTKSQYTNTKILDLAEKKKKIAIVDDIDKVRSQPKALHSLIKYLEKHFSIVILTANSEFEFASLVNKDASNSLVVYETYEIQRFNLRLRHQLIKKWCLCGTVSSKPKLDEQIHVIESLVNTIIGKRLVPSQPIFLLILIQSCQQKQQSELQNSTFAYYYQYIITKSLGEVGVTREELDELFNYLSNFAWFMRKSSLKEIALKDIKLFNEDFCKSYSTVNLNDRLSLLCSAKILIKRGDYFSFTYPYIYYYFLGKFLADNLYKTEIKEIVEEYCDNLYKYQNAHAILFLTHHNNNHPWILKRILSVLQGCFKDSAPMALDNDVEKINTLIATTSHLLVNESNVDVNQEESRKIKDEFENSHHQNDDETEKLEEPNSFVSKMNLLLRTAEILGQILKNYYGSLERDVKNDLIDEIFNSPLRFLGSLLASITFDPLVFVKEIESAIVREHPDLDSDKREEMARRFTFHILGIMGTGLILRTAEFVGSNKLQEDISTVVQKNKTNAYKLIEIATYLSKPGPLPLDEIRKLAAELKDNSFAFKILQSLGYNHLYQYHMRETEKQRLCSYLDITITKSHKIDFQTKHRKLLK